MLSPYSAQILPVFLDAFPEFQSFANIQVSYFTIQLTSPSGLPFLISSENNELTVCFSEHHCHFTSFDGRGGMGGYPMDDAEEAIEYIQKLISGESSLAVWTKDGKLSMSTIYQVQDGPWPAKANWFTAWLWGRWIRKRKLEVRKW